MRLLVFSDQLVAALLMLGSVEDARRLSCTEDGVVERQRSQLPELDGLSLSENNWNCR